MPDLREQLDHCFQGRVCLMGLGNKNYGDDGLGVLLAEMLGSARAPRAAFDASPNAGSRDPWASQPVGEGADRGSRGGCPPHVVVAGATPERFIGRIANAGYDHVIFLDAVEFGGAPGSVVFLDSEEMAARFPQISTHKISLGVLAKWVEEKGTTQAWLLGVQPESLKPGAHVTPPIQRTLKMLAELLIEMSATVCADSAFRIPHSAFA